MKKVYAEDLLNLPNLGLKLAAGGKGLKTTAILPEIQKVGLALAGHFENIDPRKIQVFGRTEISYLKKISVKKRKEIIGELFARKAAAYLVTAGRKPPKEMLEEADKYQTPLITSTFETIRCIKGIIKSVEEIAAREQHISGVLVDIMGVGVLIIGPSGIGKSECALELVVRGHRLVADDVVVLKKLSDGRLVGSGAELLRYLVEIRGIGIVNVRDLFGISSIKAKKTVAMVVELVHWDDKESYDRLGLDEHTYTVAGVNLPYMKMPVTPGRNIAVIVEVAARNHALKSQGSNAAAALDRKLSSRLAAEGVY